MEADLLMLSGERPDDWLSWFHAGERRAIEACYHEHVGTVDRAVGRVLGGADRETVVQEVFLRLLANAELRRAFQGGSFPSWIGTIARNQAIDFARRRLRETTLDDRPPEELPTATAELERKAEARILVERFRKEHLPEKWQGVFQARFLEQLDQPVAAKRLGIARTTLAYQEHCIRRLLKRFLLKMEQP